MAGLPVLALLIFGLAVFGLLALVAGEDSRPGPTDDRRRPVKQGEN